MRSSVVLGGIAGGSIVGVEGHASAHGDASTLKTRGHRRREQSACSSPSGGCGYGIWNPNSCQCNCIPPYCFDEIFQACASPGPCSDAFAGCTPGLTCPYFPTPMNGKCASGDKITPGVYEIYWTEEECCRATYNDPSKCLPTASPTGSPSATPEDNLLPVPSPDSTSMVGVSLRPIPLEFHNLPIEFDLNDDRREEMKDIILDNIQATSYESNVTVLSVDIADNIFVEQGKSLPLEVRIEVTGQRVLPTELADSYQKDLQDDVSEIENTLKMMWDLDLHTNDTFLTIGSMQAVTPAKPASPSNVVVTSADPIGDEGKKSGPIWAGVIISILLLSIGGLLLWRRRKNKEDDEPPPFRQNPEEMFDESSKVSKLTVDLDPDQTFQPMESRRNHVSFNESRSSKTRKSSQKSRRSQKSYRNTGMDPSCSNLMSPSKRQISRQAEHNTEPIHRPDHTSMSPEKSSSRRRNDHKLGHMAGRNRGMDPSAQDLNFDQQMSCGADEAEVSMNEHVSGGTQRMGPYSRDLKYDQKVSWGLDEAEVTMNEHVSGGVNRRQSDAEEELENGYDGGKSSFFIAKGQVPDGDDDEDDDDSSDQDIGGEESSADEGNVLGLLYYHGASSAEESDGKESGKSRRSRRTNKSGRTRGSGQSGKSSKHSSRSRRKKKKKKPKQTSKASEPHHQGQHQQQQFNNCEGRGQTVVGEGGRNPLHRKYQETSYVSQRMKGGDLSGSIVYTTENSRQRSSLDEAVLLPGNTRALSEPSTFSNGSTIRTEDTHRNAYPRQNESRQDEYALSFNSEFSNDLACNEPEVKF